MYNTVRLPFLTSSDSPLSFYFNNLPAEFLLSFSLTPFLLSGFIIAHIFNFVKYFSQKFLSFSKNIMQIHILLKNMANFQKCVKI